MKSWKVLLTVAALVGIGCVLLPTLRKACVREAAVALVPEENKAALRLKCAGLSASGSIHRGGLYLREIEGKTYLFRYAEYDRAVDSVWEKELAPLIKPVPEAERKGIRFEPMECLFYEAGASGKTSGKDITRIAMFTELRPGKEAWYRLLHSNPWPDVIAAIRKANFRNFSIFLEEIDGRIYLFGWLEYTGKDINADAAENKKDPASIRWWKETDACQIAPADANGAMWSGMEEICFAR
jgi:L-rhamnose mutarotase